MIKENVQRLLQELPGNVELEAAAKGRSGAQILEAIESGVKIIGENYVQEAEQVLRIIGSQARARTKWHFIGHLQKNKVRKAVKLFDLIETVDAQELAAEIDKHCAQEQKVMPVLVEINSGKEAQKFGVMPEQAEDLVKNLSCLKNIKVVGLMTMGPLLKNSEELCPYFARTKKLFDNISALNFCGVEMKYLSMGMSATYQIAIEEGANIVRIGSKIFGNIDYSDEKLSRY